VTIDTVSHLEVSNLADDFDAADVAVAGGTGHPRLDVRRVDELDGIRQAMDSRPVDGLGDSRLVEQLRDLCLRGSALGALDLAEVVTEEALRDSRDARGLVRAHRAVAELTVDARSGDVSDVRKRDGLLGALAEAKNRRGLAPPSGPDEIENQNHHHGHAEANGRDDDFDDGVVVQRIAY